MPVFSINKTLAAIQLLAQSGTQENAERVAGLIGVQLVAKNAIVEYTTKKGKVIRGVVRTDLSYAEAKAIDEYTFKKDGGWFIREKHLGGMQVKEQEPIAKQDEPLPASVKSDALVSDADNGIDTLELKYKPASKKYKNPEIEMSPKDGAKLLKQTLTKLFPDTKFSVVMSRGTGYGSADVSWSDGASYELVDVIVRHFKGKGFDGSDDSSYYLNSINSEGKVVSYGLGYIGTSRGYSKSFLEKLKATLPEHFQKQMDVEGVTIKGVGDGAYFDANEHWTQDTLRKAMSSTSTGHYGFVKVKAKEADIVPIVEPATNQMPNLMQDATGLDPAIKDMVKEYYDLVHSPDYIDGRLADPTLENWERKEYLSVKADHEKRRIELETHLNETILNTLGIDWIAYYKQLSSTNEAPPTYTPKGENNVSSPSNTLESNSNTGGGSNSQSSVENSNANGSSESGRVAGSSIDGLDARGRLQRDSSVSVPKNDGSGIGTASDSIVSHGSGQRGTGKRDNASNSGGSDSIDEPRSPVVAKRDTATIRATARNTSTNDLKLKEQLEAEGVATKWGDADNINKALPYLLPEQRDDVAKAEKRLIDDNKNGMLFTNGTGTGKTFTGLGIAKRFANAGKKNILIVSMNDKIIRDFIKSALSLNLDIHQLDGVTDNGKDKIVATTYANLAQNLMLGKRDWDLIVVDEAHNLMQGEKGENTNALAKLRALSGHHSGFGEWVKMRHAEKDPKPIGENPETGNPIYDQDEVSAWEQFKKPLREQWQKTWAEQPKGRTKVIFLTATPFSYVKTLDWAEGYLFDFVPPKDKFSNDTETMGLAYNSGNEYERFYMDNFGYKMRTNRLTRPDGRVDVGILERKFAEKLKTEGAMSGRDLSVPFDYDRKFVLIDSKIGEKIDEGFKFLWSEKDKDGQYKYGELLTALNRQFDYLSRIQLLEAIKADAAIDQIKKHIALGRKVIVFHDYNVGGGSNPFVLTGGGADEEAAAQYEAFKSARPDLIGLELDLDAPITAIKRAFPKAMLFNGTVSKGQRSKNADLFNSDDGTFNLLIAQSDAAATGISLHDTTGIYQRVIINIGMPAKPAKLRQTEGRIYRVGQASNAIQRYLTTGTDWERSTFSQKIAERAETVDNLAQGESAVVSIKDALVQAYEEAEYFEPSENDGIGGKAYDAENSRINALSPFQRAKTDYWVKAKVTAKRGEREGKEWYATPEPVGLMMVKLAGAHSGDDLLEPSAGDGAIGRYMPSDASVTMVEPSESLASRARMSNTNATVIVDTFESHGSNNKYDAIVMNPPFGNGGAIAINHLTKSFEHLREGGRVVALLPVGAMDKLIEKYKDGGYFKDIYQVADIALPSCTFENAGTKVNTRIVVFEKHTMKGDASSSMLKMDLTSIENIGELFDRIEDVNIQPRKPRVDEALAEYGLEIYPERSKYIITGEGTKRKDITATLFGSYIEKNSDGDIVERGNRGAAFVRWLKDARIPTMKQFNSGLTINNMPIKYRSPVNKYNIWDGLGDMPDWLLGFINYNGKKLEDFAVEKPVYDSLNSGVSLMDTLSLITSLSKKKSEAVAQQLADAIGVRIKKPSPTDFTLSTYTEADLRAQESVLKAAEAKRQADEKAAKDKAIADKQVGDFRLSGSSMPSDVAASYGQNDMFVQTRGLQVEKPLPTKVIFNGLDLSDPETYKDEKIAKIAKLVGKMPQLLPSGMGYSAFRAAILAGKYPQLVFDALEKDRVENEKTNKKAAAKDNAAKAALPMLLGMALPSGYSLSQEGDLIVLRGKFNDAINTVVKSAGGSWNGMSKDNLKLWEIPNDGSAILYRGISKLVTTQPIVDTARPLSDEEKAAQLEQSRNRAANESAIKIKAMSIQGVGFYAGLTVMAGDKRYIVDFKYDEHLVAKIKAIDGSKYKADTKTWLVPFEQAEQLKLIVDDVKQKAIDKTQQGKDAIAKQLADEKAQGIINTYDLLYAYPTKSALGTQRTIKGVVYDVVESSKPVKVDSSDVGSLGGEIGGDRDAWMVNLKLKPVVSQQYDDIGGFTFTPAIALNDTLNAIVALAKNNSQANADKLAKLLGVKLAPKQELDMFGDPIQNNGFDLFGEPIQDGDDSPVEELPRLAIQELPLAKLTLSEDVPQFKSGVEDSDTGVVEALGGKFDRTGVAPIQVWERLDGRLEIISGRHRTDLARRSGEKTIPAQVHKESEGFTAKQAMMLDAELNIRDGQGKVKDYVDYFSHSEISEDEADKRGLLARSIGQRAFMIASKGSEELLTLHRNDIISDQAAADIANIAPNNSAMQAVGLRVLQEHKPLNNALNTIRAVMALTREKGQEPDTFDLFGFDDSALKEAEAMAKVASRKQRQIAEQLTAIKGAVKNPKLAAKHGVIVENEADALAKVKTMTLEKSRWDNWSSHADLLTEVRGELNNKLDSIFDEDEYYWLCQEELDLIAA